MGRPIEGYYAIKSVFRLAFRRFPYPPMSDTPVAPARTVRWRAINPKQLLSLAGNTRETIARFHGSFAVLFSRLFSRHASNSEGSHEKGLNNGTASNRD